MDFLALLETRTNRRKAMNIAKRLGFDQIKVVDAQGFSGGIWCLWDSSKLKVSSREESDQFVHLELENSNGKKWCSTIVYASPNHSRRRILWEKLMQVASTVSGPWSLMGDFNATLAASDRKSNRISGGHIDKDFSYWVEALGMNELEFKGPAFTWKRGNTESRIDRVLVNDDWLSHFLNAILSHLPFFKSDHRPLLLRLDLNNDKKITRPFCFIASWILHEDFENFVKKNWNTDKEWTSNIEDFIVNVCKWNKNVFGNIEKQKRVLLKRLEGINNYFTVKGESGYLEGLQAKLWKELENVLIQDELMWAQKARVNWFIKGDKNTRFFHILANQRRKRNRIEAIRDTEGNWCYEIEEIKNTTLTFFSELFKEKKTVREEIACEIKFPSIDHDLMNWVGREVDDLEVKKAIFDIGALKSPGLD